MRQFLSLAIGVLAAAIGWHVNKIEYFGILALEGCLRLFYRLDPRLYSERRRLHGIREGASNKATGKFFVLLLHAQSPVPRFTRNLIEAIKQSPFNLVLVTNNSLNRETVDALLPNCRLLIERANIGRDFGGYKDGISVVTRRFPVIKRLVIANDSVFYLDGGLDKLLADLDGPDDFIGVSEVYDHHYHIASFLISFSGRVVGARAFRRFWKRYLPISSRRWAILKGEGALTGTLLRAGFRPHVLYRAIHLRSRLADSVGLIALKPLLPPAIFRALNGKPDRTFEMWLEDFGLWVRGKAKVEQPKEFADAVIDQVMARNQMHAAGFMFREFLGLPLIKRDICYRHVHSYEHISGALSDIEPPLREEILADFRRRGNADEFGFVLRILHRHGVA